jgi:general secretion pathway protein I
VKRGFTLIEVLVALAIAALGLAAVLAVVTNGARNASAIRERTLAGYIALNAITTVRLQSTLPPVDRTTGDLDYAGASWKWTQTVTQTDVPGIRRIDVRVRLASDAEDDSRASVTGFAGHAQMSAAPIIIPWDGSLANAMPGPGSAVTPPTPGVSPGVTPSIPLQPPPPGAVK